MPPYLALDFCFLSFYPCQYYLQLEHFEPQHWHSQCLQQVSSSPTAFFLQALCSTLNPRPSSRSLTCTARTISTHPRSRKILLTTRSGRLPLVQLQRHSSHFFSCQIPPDLRLYHCISSIASPPRPSPAVFQLCKSISFLSSSFQPH